MEVYDILIVDDDQTMLQRLADHINELGYSFSTADSGKTAMKIVQLKRFDLIITDMFMDSIDGIDILKKAKAKNPGTKVILLAELPDIASARAALKYGADDYMHKNAEIDEIFFRISRCLRHYD